jgi:hypothetical protein
MSQVFRNGSSFVNCFVCAYYPTKPGSNFVTVDILQWTLELVLRVRFNAWLATRHLRLHPH